MFRQIWIERRAWLGAMIIMFHDFFQRGETPIVHVRRGQFHVAQRRRGELAAIYVELGEFETARVGVFQAEAVVVKLMVAEQRAAVAMETIRAVATCARFVFGHEQLKPALL